MTVPVVLVAPSATAGGSQKALFGLVRHLPALGYEPTVALFEPGPLEGWLDGIGCRHERIPFGRLRNPVAVTRTVLGLRRLSQRARAELVVDNMSIAHIYGGVAARILGIPSIWWQQIIPNRDFGGPRMTRPVLDRTAARVPAAAIVVHSEAAVTAQRELTPRRLVVKVHQGIDLDEVRAFTGQGRELRARLGWEHRTIIGIVGWLVGWKGQDVFLRAAARVARSHPDVRFVVVGGPGDASFERRVHGLAGELELGENVVFTGHQSPAYPWFDAIDIVVHSSWGSPFDLVVLEAMALGKAVIATSVGGTGEVVVLHERTGLLVAPGDDDATAAAITRYLDDHQLASRVGAAARTHVEQFSDLAMAERFAAVMDGVRR